ncbi:MAG: hypothetical protein QM776_01960 [Rhodocyclaceae bacterium]
MKFLEIEFLGNLVVVASPSTNRMKQSYTPCKAESPRLWMRNYSPVKTLHCLENGRRRTIRFQQAKKTQLGWSCAKSTPKEEGGGDTGKIPANKQFSKNLCTVCIMRIGLVRRKDYLRQRTQFFLCQHQRRLCNKSMLTISLQRPFS